MPMTSIPSVNLTPWISFGNWLCPSMRRQFFCAPSTSLKTMASAVLFDRQPFDRMVRCRTVAKVLSMGLVVRKCFQCSAGKSQNASSASRSLVRQSAALSYLSIADEWLGAPVLADGARDWLARVVRANPNQTRHPSGPVRRHLLYVTHPLFASHNLCRDLKDIAGIAASLRVRRPDADIGRFGCQRWDG